MIYLRDNLFFSNLKGNKKISIEGMWMFFLTKFEKWEKSLFLDKTFPRNINLGQVSKKKERKKKELGLFFQYLKYKI